MNRTQSTLVSEHAQFAMVDGDINPHSRQQSNTTTLVSTNLEAVQSRTDKPLATSATGPSDVPPTRPSPRRSTFTERWFSPAPWKSGWSRWLAEDIPTERATPSLVMQAFATGVLDATTYADYRTFASNQTGNTILLAVSAFGNTEVLIMSTAISLGTFLFCAGLFGHLGHFMGPRRRSWVLLTNLIQLSALLVALILLTPAGPSIFHVGARHEWLILAIFAGMSGAQVTCARQSGSAELPTAPMTSSYVDLVADRYLLCGFTDSRAGGRNRRLIYILVMWLGAMLGAVVHKYGGSAEVVGLTMALKCLAVILVSVVKGQARMGENVAGSLADPEKCENRAGSQA